MASSSGVYSQHQPGAGGAKLAPPGVSQGWEGPLREAPIWKMAGHQAGCPADMRATMKASSAAESGTASAQPAPCCAQACCACGHGSGLSG